MFSPFHHFQFRAKSAVPCTVCIIPSPAIIRVATCSEDQCRDNALIPGCPCGIIVRLQNYSAMQRDREMRGKHVIEGREGV